MKSSLNIPQLEKVIPEHKDNPHFQVNRSANILRMDYKLERAKVDEAQASKPAVATKPAPVAQTNEAEKAKAVLPGSKSTKKAPVKGTARPKTSMFMPTNRPAVAAGRGGRQMAVSTFVSCLSFVKDKIFNRVIDRALPLVTLNRASI